MNDTNSSGDRAFAGSIPKIYEQYLVPLIFEHYASDFVARLRVRNPQRVLEIAAGTGVVTRALASGLPADTDIIATDLNQAMLDEAAATGTARPVEWRQADARQLPFDDASFDAVVCQFGVMFFPDKPGTFAEIRRVLKPGGVFLFNTWDGLHVNGFADLVTQAVAGVFPDDPPRFLARTPYAWNDAAVIAADVQAGGFAAPELRVVTAVSRAARPDIPAIAFCQGTPLRSEIEARDAGKLAQATEAAAALIAKQCGTGEVEATMQALVVTALR